MKELTWMRYEELGSRLAALIGLRALLRSRATIIPVRGSGAR